MKSLTANPSEHALYMREWRSKHPEHTQYQHKYHKQWYRKNRTTVMKCVTKWSKMNPVRTKRNKMRSHLRNRCSLEDYEKMLLEQDGLCAICNLPCATGQRLAADHCHVTGKQRGLLCRKCNTGIGFLGDSVDMLKRAMIYLESYK